MRFVRHILVAFALLPAFAQQKAGVAGDYEGAVGPIHVKLHLVAGADGTVSGTVDSPDQGMFGLPCADLSVNGQAISFTVPNVRGEYMGTVGADGASLTGIWKQAGRPTALNFARGGAGGSPASAAPVPAAGPAAANSVAGPAKTQCTPTYGTSYWDGSAWKPMVQAAHLGRENGVSIRDGLKNPFNPRAGITTIVMFKNPEANLILEASPRFCVPIPVNQDPTVVMIGFIDVKKDHRELETCAGMCASKGRSADSWMPEKRLQPIDINRISDTLVEITLKNPLKPGQYLLGGPPLVGYYDFGVKAANASQ
jgi:hypothetical protein